MISNYIPQRKKAFTLIELLITTALMSLVSIAIISVFAAGINVYSRTRNYSNARADILFCLEKMERDLRNVCSITGIDFVGEPTKVTFPSTGPGSTSYYIDNSSHYLVSEERDFSAATAMEPPKGKVTSLVYAVGVKFSYYYFDPKTASYYWKDAWVKEKEDEKPGVDASKLGAQKATEAPGKEKLRVNTPLGIKVEIRYDDHPGSAVLERTVFFPIAVSLHFAQAASEKKEKEKAKEKEEEKDAAS